MNAGWIIPFIIFEEALYAGLRFVNKIRAGPFVGITVTAALISTLCSFPAGTVMGPGFGAVPGTGCGNAVAIAV